jgi:hypothetical protein
MVGNSWIPAIWLIFRLGGVDPLRALQTFILGYLAFISWYELGYLTNDSWDAARSPSGRRRIAFPVTPLYMILFVAIRLALWAAVGIFTGWIMEPTWLWFYAALAVVFGLHNALQSPTVRIATFMQLSVLRFMLPVAAVLNARGAFLVYAVAVLFYTIFRLLSYLDSKNLLNMSDRRTGLFKLQIVGVQAPIVLLLSVVAKSSLIAEMFVYYLGFYTLIALRERGKELPRSATRAEQRSQPSHDV